MEDLYDELERVCTDAIELTPSWPHFLGECPGQSVAHGAGTGKWLGVAGVQGWKV